jgi:H+/Cl- antiporter ClcA
MRPPQDSVRKTITREASLFLGLLLIGLVLLPVAVYIVGQAIFGDYGGGSYGHFISELSGRVRTADPAAWFLVLSPYLGWQILRLVALVWRVAGQKIGSGNE